MMLNLNKTKLALSLFSLAALLNCVAISTLESALEWSSPVDLSSEGKNAVNPQISINPAGNATVIWSRTNGSNYVIQATQAKLGKNPRWSNPGRISRVGNDAFFGKIANDSANNSVAVWTRSNGINTIVQAAYKNSPADWTEPVNLSISGQSSTSPQIAIDAARNVTAVWSRNNGSNNIIQSSVKKVGQPWSPPQNVTLASSGGLGDVQPNIVADQKGNVYAFWINDSTSTIRGAVRHYNNGRWTNPIDISASGHRVSFLDLAIDGQGLVSAVWSRYDGLNDIIQTTSGSESTVLSTPIDLSLPGQNAVNAQIAVDANGNKVVVWQRSNGINTIIQAAVQFVGGTWLSPVDLSVSGQDASDPQVKIDQAGNIVVVWKRSDGVNFVVEYTTAKFLATSSWSTPETLSVAGEDATSPQLAFDNSGKVVVVWQRSDGANSIVQATVGVNVANHH